ncbi:MAG: adenylosuccinate lyase family protein [Gemmatimonas sp.]|nr:adenylosuccinate lyase family protein [Gemmatimonas sp.]
MLKRFTAGRVPDPGVEELFSIEARWQAWLEVEAALAQAQAELGLVTSECAEAIASACDIESLDLERIRSGVDRMSHPFMPLVVELSRVVGEPHCDWVHWGATTQNMTQTGDVRIIRKAHRLLLGLLGQVMGVMATLADQGAEMVMAGRTHGQHAVPITFGFKVAGWIDEMGRHVTRMREVEPRLFVALVGGAAGTFASWGEQGPEMQRRVANRLGLAPMSVASRSVVDQFAELVCVLGLLGATCGKIAREVYILMKTEYGEVEEPVPTGTVGSSTMPQKRNPQLCQDILGISAELRALVPLALEAVQSEHEADHTPTVLFETIARAMTLSGDALVRARVILGGLRLNPGRMRSNLALSEGMIMAEAVMLELGRTIGRQRAHDVVFDATQAAASQGVSFVELLASDPRVAPHLNQDEIEAMLDPGIHTGLSASIAREQAEIARRLAAEVCAYCDAAPGIEVRAR